MDKYKLGIISSIIQFLRGEFEARYLDAENSEGLEVAIHCLENIYDVSSVQETPNLVELFQMHISSVLLLPDAEEEDKEEAEKYKTEGNRAMSAERYVDAMALYTKAINCDPKNAVYYCNRAAAKSKMNEHLSAIHDCKVALKLDPKYTKAYGRLGLAYCGIEAYTAALENYRKAYELEPTNEGYRRNFDLARQKLSEACRCNPPRHLPDPLPPPGAPSAPSNTAPSAPSNTAPSAPSNPLGQGCDLSSLLANPHLINFASEMLADPEMINVMTTMMSNESGMDIIIQAGQNLARHMQAEHPDFFNHLRQTLANQPGQQADESDDRSVEMDEDEPAGGNA